MGSSRATASPSRDTAGSALATCGAKLKSSNRWDQAEQMLVGWMDALVRGCTLGHCHYTPASTSPRTREPIAFEQDETIARGWVFRVFSAWLCTYADIVHGFEVSGLEKIADNEPVLFILPHSTHNVDIFVCLFKMQQLCGRFPRGLFHRGVMLCWGWLLRFFGGVPGKRDIAHELAKAGIHTACVPGGVEDVLHHLTGNGRTAYELCWESHNKPGELRTGFGAVAAEIGAGFKIVPMFVENGEEIKCNLLFEVWTLLRLDVLYGSLMRIMPPPIHWFMWQVAIFLWCTLSFCSLVVPVKVTAHLGDAVVVGKDESSEDVARRAHLALQALIDSKLRRRHRSYSIGLKMRYEHLKLQLSRSRLKAS